MNTLRHVRNQPELPIPVYPMSYVVSKHSRPGVDRRGKSMSIDAVNYVWTQLYTQLVSRSADMNLPFTRCPLRTRPQLLS